jgi:hypothetical protein
MKRIILLFIFFLANQLSWAQFSATMKNVMYGKEHIYQVYNDGQNYRYEFTDDDMDGIVIVHPAANETSILIPEKKYVHHTTCDDAMSRMNDPVQAVNWFKNAGEVKNEGEEKIGKYQCTRQVVYQGDNKVFTVWMADELNFPVKILNHHDTKTHMELVDVKNWNVDPSFFQVPDDYTEVDKRMRPIIPETPPPNEWITRILDIPGKRICKRGEKILIDITTSTNYRLTAINNSESPAKFIRSVWKDGAELPDDQQGPLKYRTRRIFSGEKYSNVFYWKEGERIFIDVHEGELQLEVEPEKRPIN